MSISISLPRSDNTYDEVPYESYPYPQSHPNTLATIAALFNMEATLPATSRILELGCAAGGNIIPLAIAYPKTEIVGVDLSKVQIELANQQIKDLKLSNIKFHHASITDIDDSYGKFDYIIAHRDC
jgi:cyclopropane fatty-acyl-phospholipid synthase-like methyltransferase